MTIMRWKLKMLLFIWQITFTFCDKTRWVFAWTSAIESVQLDTNLFVGKSYISSGIYALCVYLTSAKSTKNRNTDIIVSIIFMCILFFCGCGILWFVYTMAYFQCISSSRCPATLFCTSTQYIHWLSALLIFFNQFIIEISRNVC